MKDKANDRERVRRLLDGDLSAVEEHDLRRAMADSEELKLEAARHGRLRELLADSVGHFDAFFATRVLAAVHARLHEDEWTMGLLVAFRKVALVATILTGILLTYNVATQWNARGDLNAVEITLAIPPATIQSSLDHMDFGL